MSKNIVKCQQCGTWLDLGSFAVGQAVACPCGTRLTVPAPEAAGPPPGDQSWQRRTSAGFQPPPPSAPPPMPPPMMPGMPGVHIRPPRLPTDTRASSMTALDIIICVLIPCIGLIKGEERGRAMVKLSIIAMVAWFIINLLLGRGCYMRTQ